MSDDSILISVVVPVRDEVENVEVLAGEIERALAGLPGGWECIWVDDASTDGTLDRLQAIADYDNRHRVLHFSPGRGQTAALLAGFRHSSGEFVSSLDGDRQNDPADLPRLLDYALTNGIDLVNGVRVRRQDSRLRRLSSRIANSFRNWMTRDSTTDVGCAIRVMRRRFISAIPTLRGMHRFLPTFVRLAGGRVAEIPVNHRPRVAGRTKYGVSNRLWVGIEDTLAVRWFTRRFVRLEPAEETTISGAPENSEPGSLGVEAPAIRSSVRPSGWPAWVALAGLALALGFAFQGTRGLWEPDEGRYAECAREMIVTRDFLTPRLGFEPHFTKPPLTYWSIAIPVALFGRNPWAVRLYLSLAYAATVLLVAALGRKLWSERAGFLAALIYATSLLPFAGAGIATPDTLLTLWEVLALYSFWRSWTAESAAEKRFWPAVTGTAFGLAFLTKGPPGLLFLPAMILFRLLPAGRRKGAAPILTLPGLLLFLGVGFSWYVMVILKYPGLLHTFITEEIVGRVVGVHHRNHQWYGPLVIYGPAFLAGSLPWVFLWPRLWRRVRADRSLLSRKLWHARPRSLFLALTLAVPMVVFCLSRSRLPLYVLPLFVPVALVTARALLGTTTLGEEARVTLHAVFHHRWAPRLAAWAVVLVLARLAFAAWPSPQDAWRTYREVRPPAGSDLVFVDTLPRFGLAFYMGEGVESAFWKEQQAGSKFHDHVEDEVEEVRSGDRHVFLIPMSDESRLTLLLDGAGMHSQRHVTLGHFVAVIPE